MGFLLAGLASLSFVALDVLRKILGDRLTASQIVIGINLGAGLVFLPLLYRFGTLSADGVFWTISAIEVITFSVASLLYVRAVTLSPLSLTIPYLAFTPVVSAITAAITLHEIPSKAGLIGILLVATGALILHLEVDVGFKDLLRAPFREPGSWRMLLVAFIWGLTTSLDKLAIQHGSELLLGTVLTLGSACLLLALQFLGISAADQPREPSRPFKEPLLILAAIVAAAAVLAQFFAYRELLVAYVETVKRAGGLLSALIGIIFFHEGGFGHRLPAAALMVLGVLLLML